MLLLTPAGAALAQAQSAQAQQEDPVAAAARRAREQKKQQTKPSRVWDNDNIPKSPGSLSVVGVAPSDTAVQGNSAGAHPSAGPSPSAGQTTATPAEKKTALEADLAAAKENLQNLQSDLDILQRKLTLDQQMYYGKPGYSSDKAGAAALGEEQDQVDAKQQEIGDAQKKITDLQEKLNTPTGDAQSNNPQ
jgi:hypothetical protein